MSIDMGQFLLVFYDEAEELLAEKERLLLAVDITAPDAEDLNAIFRATHSLKGGAATFGLTDMTEVAHVLESLLDRIRKGEMALTSEHVDAFLSAKDILKAQLDGHRHGASVDMSAVAAVRTKLQTLASALQAADQASRARQEDAQGYGIYEPSPLPPTEPYGFFQPIEEIRAGGYASAVPVDAQDQDLGQKEDRKLVKSDKAGATNTESSSIRVSIEKVDQLINLIGELVITQAMIKQRADSLDPLLHEHLLGNISHLTRNTRDLQDAVMSIRMMPMDFVFSRFPRMVRDLAAKLGKKVDFVTSGAATELDKGLIERIVDPLTHLVRNSIDHGIELPGARTAAGKSEVGRLFLSASHQGGNIVIEVSDDGAGLSRERILAKAREQGLAVSDDMSDGEVWQLIFAPGFSTAAIVTDVSGRGVGMDVVRRNISAMDGVVNIRSAKGFGTTISIALPLTLAILDGMLIRVGDEVYILPLGFVVESLKPAPEDIKEINGKGQVVKVRGEYLPLIPLHQVFDIAPRFTNPAEGIVVILEADGRKAALFVDDLVGQQQVVVKNLESNYRKVVGISGATILGDGCVSLILDVAAIMRAARPHADAPSFS